MTGARRVVLAVALLFGAAAMAFGQVAGLLWLTIGFGALRFLGQGSLMLSCANLVAQWFDRKRGLALSSWRWASRRAWPCIRRSPNG